MKLRWLAIILFSISVFSVSALAGKPKRKKPEPKQAAPTPTPAQVQPSPSPIPDALPSASLQPFLDAHLDRIFAPLDADGLKQPDLVADLKSSLTDGLSKASPERQPAFQAALAVCDALANGLNERQAALNNLQGLSSSASSSSLGVVSDVGRRDPSPKQRQSEARARELSKQTGDSFKNAQKSQWVQRAAVLRQGVQQLYTRERAIESQAATATHDKAVAAARQEAVRRYPDLGVEGSKFNADFVGRYNYYKQAQPNYFQDASWPIHLAEEVAQAAPAK